MSFKALLRAAPLRQAALTGSRTARVGFSRAAFRKYSTEVPPAAKKSNNGLLIGLGAVAGIGGVAYYVYANERNELKSGVQAAKVKANFVPTQEDYQKVHSSLHFGCPSRLSFSRFTTALLNSWTPTNTMA
jgi:cytochrome c peroxidase